MGCLIATKSSFLSTFLSHSFWCQWEICGWTKFSSYFFYFCFSYSPFCREKFRKDSQGGAFFGFAITYVLVAALLLLPYAPPAIGSLNILFLAGAGCFALTKMTTVSFSWFETGTDLSSILELALTPIAFVFITITLLISGYGNWFGFFFTDFVNLINGNLSVLESTRVLTLYSCLISPILGTQLFQVGASTGGSLVRSKSKIVKILTAGVFLINLLSFLGFEFRLEFFYINNYYTGILLIVDMATVLIVLGQNIHRSNHKRKGFYYLLLGFSGYFLFFLLFWFENSQILLSYYVVNGYPLLDPWILPFYYFAGFFIALILLRGAPK